MSSDYFVGKAVTIDELNPDDACAIFGRPVFEAWRSCFAGGLTYQHSGVYRVSKIDRTRGTITLEWQDLPNPKATI